MQPKLFNFKGTGEWFFGLSQNIEFPGKRYLRGKITSKESNEIMTDMVMIVAVLPLALIVTTGAELHRPLAVVYIGGFFFAILFRLIIVPLLYETLTRPGKKVARKGIKNLCYI